MSGIVEEAVAERLEGEEPGRLRALGAAVLTYRLLRGGSESDDD